MKRLPPAGTIVPLRTFLAPLHGGAEDTTRLETHMANSFLGDSAAAFNSGRAALAAVLASLAATRGGKGVIIPAYTCTSVPSAVVRAGLKIFPADLIPETLDFNYRSTDPPPKEVFAVVSPGLFGIPPDMENLQSICRRNRVFLIEDAAQTLGARVHDRPAGSFGDLSLFSFSRGKPLGGMGGGVLVARGRALSDSLQELRIPPGRFRPKTSTLSALAAGMAIRPRIFQFLRLLPFIHLGSSVFYPGFPSGALPPGGATLILALFALSDDILKKRREVGNALRSLLDETPGVLLPRPPEGIESAHLRFPLIFEEPSDRDAALYRLTSRGLGASTMYPRPIHKLERAREHIRGDLGPYPGAERIARGIMTLPTHAGVTTRDMDKMAEIIHQVARAGG